MVEFSISTDLAKVAPKEILANFAEVKEYINNALKDHLALVVTEDSVAQAKTMRANVNKIARAIEDQKKAVKKMLLTAYDSQFAPACDELLSICKEASGHIDEQVKAIEAKEKEEKLKAVKLLWDAWSEGIKLYYPWESVVNPKWGNKTYSMDQIQKDLSITFARAESDLDAIRSFDGDDTAVLLDVYRETHNLATVMQKKKALTDIREREERRREQEEQAERAVQVVKEVPSVKPQETPQEAAREPDMAESEVSVSLTAYGTRKQLMGLAAYMKSNGIRFERFT